MPQCPPPPCRRLADQLLLAFHAACDEGAGPLALALLILLERHVNEPAYLPPGGERRAVVRFQEAHERLRNLPLAHGDGRGDDASHLAVG